MLTPLKLLPHYLFYLCRCFEANFSIPWSCIHHTRTRTQTDILANDQFNSFIRILQSFANTIMAISASRYTVGTGFKGVLLVYVEGFLLYICCMVTENYSTKCLELKTNRKQHFCQFKPPKKQLYILIRNALPWLWRYGLVFLRFDSFILAQKKCYRSTHSDSVKLAAD